MSNNPSSSTDEQNRLPKDALVVQTMLQEMGITNYEPKLIPMVLDFMHRSLKINFKFLFSFIFYL